MRIAFLCKRRYMGKDVIDDRYARLYEIPYQLARLGHEVHGYCLGYLSQPSERVTHEAAPGSLTWSARSLGSRRATTLASYPGYLLRELRALSPDIVIGASDIPHVVLAAWVARRLRVPYAADLYDNFEGFGQARIPGFKTALRRATRRADLVTTTSEALRELVVDGYRARGLVVAMPSTVDLSIFARGDQLAARDALGLPRDAVLIGTAGGLHKDKGVGTLYAAWRELSAKDERLHLVLAGPTDSSYPPPSGPRVHYLGMLPHHQTATLFRSLDAGVIYLRDTPFGRYCFPQKAYEMFACGLPVAAARIGVMPALLGEQSGGLYEADSPQDLARAIISQLTAPQRPAITIEDWSTIVGRLEQSLLAMANPDQSGLRAVATRPSPRSKR